MKEWHPEWCEWFDMVFVALLPRQRMEKRGQHSASGFEDHSLQPLTTQADSRCPDQGSHKLSPRDEISPLHLVVLRFGSTREAARCSPPRHCTLASVSRGGDAFRMLWRRSLTYSVSV